MSDTISGDELIDIVQIRKLYKIDLDLCKTRSNRNCSGNPRCLKGLGQQSWLLNKDQDSNDGIDDDEKDAGFRKLAFCGLRNLGATCYLNTFLQLWYHNVTLRKSFYDWRPNDSFQDILKNPIMSLQLVFSMMQFSKRATVDPETFIKCLKLDESQEQDTHEFSNLFVSYIQNKLFEEYDKSIHDTINQQYSVKIAYVSKCDACQTIRENESEFFELLLRVKGFKTVEECIENYLKKETLDGTNQYMCQICNRHQNAIRYIELRKLPPVLNLQLLRFDLLNGRSKKISSFLKFPTKLNMNKFVQDTSSPINYQLFAVLIHEGHTANSGHYITFVKRENVWYKFNDEHVEMLKSFDLKIDSEETIIGDPDQNEEEQEENDDDKMSGNVHKSKNAYMLVYRLESELDFELPNSYEECNLPQYLTEAIDEDNEVFFKEQGEFILKKSIQRAKEINHQNLVKEIYLNMEAPIDNESSFDIISKEWLMAFFQTNVQEDVKPVDNNSLLCSHKKLDMNSNFKCISTESADLIYEKFKGGPRITLPSFICYDCLSYKINLAQVKSEIDVSGKLITNLSKFKGNETDKMFWVGKESFKRWKQLRIAKVEKKFKQPIKDNFQDLQQFNSDLLCQHGQLCTDQTKKRLIKESIWEILYKQFPETCVFDLHSEECPLCLKIDQKNQEIRDSNFTIAISQRTSLQALIDQIDNRMNTWANLSDESVYHLISSKFVKTLKKFLSHPNSSTIPEEIVNDSIICDHRRFLFPPSSDEYVGLDKKYIIIDEDDWAILLSFYSCPSDVAVFKTDQQLETSPVFCDQCYEEYVELENRKRYVYLNQPIYVHKVVCDGDSDNNSDHANEDLKKHKSSHSNVDSVDEMNNALTFENDKMKNHDDQPRLHVPRRSTRRRKYKNEFEIKVSSLNKLKEIKFKIMQHFHVATYDQILVVNGKQLSSYQNNCTLAELKIEPYSVIVLRVDNKANDNIPNEGSELLDIAASTEGGFKGMYIDRWGEDTTLSCQIRILIMWERSNT